MPKISKSLKDIETTCKFPKRVIFNRKKNKDFKCTLFNVILNRIYELLPSILVARHSILGSVSFNSRIRELSDQHPLSRLAHTFSEFDGLLDAICGNDDDGYNKIVRDVLDALVQLEAKKNKQDGTENWWFKSVRPLYDSGDYSLYNLLTIRL